MNRLLCVSFIIFICVFGLSIFSLWVNRCYSAVCSDSIANENGDKFRYETSVRYVVLLIRKNMHLPFQTILSFLRRCIRRSLCINSILWSVFELEREREREWTRRKHSGFCNRFKSQLRFRLFDDSYCYNVQYSVHEMKSTMRINNFQAFFLFTIW